VLLSPFNPRKHSCCVMFLFSPALFLFEFSLILNLDDLKKVDSSQIFKHLQKQLKVLENFDDALCIESYLLERIPQIKENDNFTFSQLLRAAP
jgi:hypothetical protein